jgi:hypothetical protein
MVYFLVCQVGSYQLQAHRTSNEGGVGLIFSKKVIDTYADEVFISFDGGQV